jgi:hypothetical protein
MSNQFDALIKTTAKRHFAEIFAIPGTWNWLKAQVMAESNFDPKAKSSCGARGLLQLMPGTAEEMRVVDSYDPAENLAGGIAYLAKLYRNPRIAAVGGEIDRLKWALAAYNCGIGYVQLALALAREKEGMPYGFRLWQQAGSPAGNWQVWEFSRAHLCNPRCAVKGKNPDTRQVFDYVAKIVAQCDKYVWG